MDAILSFTGFLKQDRNARIGVLHKLTMYLFVRRGKRKGITRMCGVVLVPYANKLQGWLVKLTEETA